MDKFSFFSTWLKSVFLITSMLFIFSAEVSTLWSIVIIFVSVVIAGKIAEVLFKKYQGQRISGFLVMIAYGLTLMTGVAISGIIV